jgi:hypothetical protein
MCVRTVFTTTVTHQHGASFPQTANHPDADHGDDQGGVARDEEGGDGLAALSGRGQPVGGGQPTADWAAGQLFGTETLSMFVIVLIIGLCLSVPRLAGAVPWIAGLFIGGAIALLGTTSGGSENPARQFGPAIRPGTTGELLIPGRL